jgi:histidinol-phosphate aminotransferase
MARESVRRLKPYAAKARPDRGVFIDAGENAFGSAANPSEINSAIKNLSPNRYPDPACTKLRESLAEYLRSAYSTLFSFRNVFAGNGSDEVMDLLIRTFVEPRENIVVVEPTFQMYRIFAEANDVRVKTVLLEENSFGFTLNAEKISEAVDAGTKIVFLCSPNNPTGNAFDRAAVLKLVRELPCIVVVDEAYAEFAGKDKTVVGRVKDYGNLVVLKTLSKAWGLAGLRVGYAVASEEVVSILMKVKAPYNINALSQEIAIRALRNENRMRALVSKILRERTFLERKLVELGFRVFPSDANFLLAKTPPGVSSKALENRLSRAGVFVKDRSAMPLLENCLRITVGTRSEDNKLIKELERAAERV